MLSTIFLASTVISAPLSESVSFTADSAVLYDFGATATPWRITNDPVMGGQSYSTFAVKDGVGVFTGDCKIVPSLKAPGFCDAEAPKLKAVDGSEYNTVQITLKNKGDLVAFKSSWTGPRVPRDPDCHHPGCIFEQGIYKASFNITSAVTKPSGGDFTVVQIPYTAYTSKWSDFTGGCTDHGAICCSTANPTVCPSKYSASAITGVGIWAEGTAGKFNIEIKSIELVKV